MPEALHLIIRLLAAAGIGAVIGFEREVRLKGAGVRTHVLVAVGASLFMIISQFGFPDAVKFDAARIAAGVVTGIGFIGGGIIMKTKSHVSGLTTAAGLWVTGAMGLACGSGMFELAILTAVIVLFCLEAMHAYSSKVGDKIVTAVFSSATEAPLEAVVKTIGKRIQHYSLSLHDDTYYLETTIRLEGRKNHVFNLLPELKDMPGVKLESLE